jgi:hypothetical protein
MKPRTIPTRENPHRGRERPPFVPVFRGQNALRGSGSLPATVFHPRVFSSAGRFAIRNQLQRLARICPDDLLQPSRTPSILPKCSASSRHPEKANTPRHSFLAAKSHRVPRLVKALDRFAAHVRAALTSLGARMQNLRYVGMSQSVRSPNRAACTFALFHPPNRLSKPVRGPRQLLDRPPSHSTPTPLPPSTSSSYKRV